MWAGICPKRVCNLERVPMGRGRLWPGHYLWFGCFPTKLFELEGLSKP